MREARAAMEDDDWGAGVILEVAEDFVVVRLVSLVLVRERRVPLLHGDGMEKCD